MLEVKRDDLDAARDAAYAMSLENIDLSDPKRFEANIHWPFFDRVRRENPVHYIEDSQVDPFWSILNYDHIMEAEKSHQALSSRRGVVIGDLYPDLKMRSFIAADEPRHSLWRKPLMPAFGPARLVELHEKIRLQIVEIIDALPRNETFNWVEHVSVEITTRMLATLFDFPQKDRHLLTYWSDIATATERGNDTGLSEEKRREILLDCLACLQELWKERAKAEPKFDFISLFAHHPDTKNMHEEPMHLLGNLMLLIIAGNDTTTHSISGGLHALHEYQDEYTKLISNPGLIPNMICEMIRWQTPIAHMRRTALQDIEIGGKTIKEGDKIAMWYVSGNRDETKFDQPYTFLIDRKNAYNHIALAVFRPNVAFLFQHGFRSYGGVDESAGFQGLYCSAGCSE